MKKITFIFNGPPIYTNSISGGDAHTMFFADFIDKKESTVFICCPKEYGFIKKVKNVIFSTYPSLPFEQKMHKNNLLLFCIYWYRIIYSIGKIKKITSDVIIGSSHLFHDVIPFLFLRKKHTIFSTYVHHIISEQKRNGFHYYITAFLEKISFFVLKKVNARVFTTSKENKELLKRKYGLRDDHIYITKNGIHLNFIKEIRKDSTRAYDICFCARLHKTKGVYDLIQIIKNIKSFQPNISCALIGEGVEGGKLKQIIIQEQLETNITMLGFLSEEKKIKTMKSSRIFILPSHEEGWGIVIAEAMTCGLPVVVYRLYDIEKIWNDSVVWVDCFDTQKFSDSALELLKNENKKKLFIKRGKNLVQEMDWNVILKYEFEVIKTLF